MMETMGHKDGDVHGIGGSLHLFKLENGLYTYVWQLWHCHQHPHVRCCCPAGTAIPQSTIGIQSWTQAAPSARGAGVQGVRHALCSPLLHACMQTFLHGVRKIRSKYALLPNRSSRASPLMTGSSREETLLVWRRTRGLGRPGLCSACCVAHDAHAHAPAGARVCRTTRAQEAGGTGGDGACRAPAFGISCTRALQKQKLKWHAWIWRAVDSRR